MTSEFTAQPRFPFVRIPGVSYHGQLSATFIILKSSPAPSQTLTENVQLVRAKTAKTKKP